MEATVGFSRAVLVDTIMATDRFVNLERFIEIEVDAVVAG